MRLHCPDHSKENTKTKVQKYVNITQCSAVFAFSGVSPICDYIVQAIANTIQNTKVQKYKNTKIQKHIPLQCSDCIFGSVPAMRVGARERDHPSLRPLLSALITQLIMMTMRRMMVMIMIMRTKMRILLCKECCMSSDKKASPYLFQIHFAFIHIKWQKVHTRNCFSFGN